MRQIFQRFSAVLLLGLAMGCEVTEDSLVFDLTGNGSKSYGITSITRAGSLPAVELSLCERDDVYTFNEQGGVQFGDAQIYFDCIDNGDVRFDLAGDWTLNFGTREITITNQTSNPNYLLGTYAILEHDQDNIVLQGPWQGVLSQITLTRDAYWQYNN